MECRCIKAPTPATRPPDLSLKNNALRQLVSVDRKGGYGWIFWIQHHQKPIERSIPYPTPAIKSIPDSAMLKTLD
jgi:hypothetical protein